MNRKNIVRVHIVASILGLLTIASFFISSLITEIFLSVENIVLVKKYISVAVYGLMGFMMIAGVSGLKLAGKLHNPLVLKKFKRMKLIAINGLFILFPSALYLHDKAIGNDFDQNFYIVQCVEYIFGFTNLTLMGLNVRDGKNINKG